MANEMLQISGLAQGITEEVVKQVFGQYGPVSHCKLIPPGAGQSTASCQLGISNEAATKWILENLNGNIPQGMQAPVYITSLPASSAGQEGQAQAQGQQTASPEGKGKGEGKDANNNLYVTGLPAGCTDEQMNQIFGQYGTVVSTKLLPQVPGKTGAAGFVRFTTQQEAKYIVDNLNGNIPMGMQTPITVKFAEQAGNSAGDWECPACQNMNFARRDTCYKCNTPKAGGGTGGFGKGDDKGAGMDLYITGLPLESDETIIRQLFAPYGQVHRVKLLPVAPGRPSAAGFIRMDVDKGKWCVENLNGVQPQGFPQPLQVSVAASQGKGDKDKGKGGKGMVPPPPAPAAAYVDGASTLPTNTNPNVVTNLYITGIPHDWDEERLKGLVGMYGDVISCKVLPVNTQKNACAGFLRMAEPEAIWCVKNLTGFPPEGYNTTLQVEIAAEGKGKGKGKDEKGKGKGKDGGKGWNSYDQYNNGGKSWDGSWGKGDGYSGNDKGGKGWSQSNSWENSGWNSSNSWSAPTDGNTPAPDNGGGGWDNSNSQSQSWGNADNSQGGKGWDNSQSWGNSTGGQGWDASNSGGQSAGGESWGAATTSGGGDMRPGPYSQAP